MEHLFSLSLGSDAFGPSKLPQTFRKVFCGGHCCVTAVPPWSPTLLASSGRTACRDTWSENLGLFASHLSFLAWGCLPIPPQPAQLWLPALPDTSATVTFPQRGAPFSSGPHLSSIRAEAQGTSAHFAPEKVTSVYKSIFLTHCPPSKTLQVRDPVSLTLLQ